MESLGQLRLEGAELPPLSPIHYGKAGFSSPFGPETKGSGVDSTGRTSRVCGMMVCGQHNPAAGAGLRLPKGLGLGLREGQNRAQEGS